MKNVGWAAAIGAGVALVAFLIDWLGDKLDTPEEAEPLWPASKPFSRTHTHYPTDNWVVGGTNRDGSPWYTRQNP